MVLMGLADTFQQIVDSLSDDWSDMDLDLRIYAEDQTTLGSFRYSLRF